LRQPLTNFRHRPDAWAFRVHSAARHDGCDLHSRTIRTSARPNLARRCAKIALKRILVATDFGEAAEAVLNYGREFARLFGASLDVVHVCDDVFARGVGVDGFAFDYTGVQRDLEAAARRQLDGLLDNEDR
jgi:hypothetical protein